MLGTMNKHASALGKLGGAARAKKLSKKRRAEIARMGAETANAKMAQQRDGSLSTSDA